MGDLLKENLRALHLTDPELADEVAAAPPPVDAVVEPAQNGLPTLTRGGMSFHSRIDPEAEAEALAEAIAAEAVRRPGLIPGIFGLGLGHHVRALALKVQRVLVIESDPGLIRLAFSNLDFTPVMTRLSWAVGLPGPTGPEDFFVRPHPPSARLKPAEYDLWRRASSQARGVTAEKLRAVLSGIPGAGKLPGQADPELKLNFFDVEKQAAGGEGRMTPLEIYILLLREFSPTAPAHRAAPRPEES